MSTNDPTSAEDVLRALRTPPRARQLFGGFGPLVLGVVLVLTMILLAPSVAPEQLVERPVESTQVEDDG